MNKIISVQNTDVRITRGLVTSARLRNEYYDFVREPEQFISALHNSETRADLFSFLSEIHNLTPLEDYYHELDSISVLPISTYEEWWTKQISDKTRNMARKAQKKGVEIHVFNELTDDFVRGIMGIHNEAPVRQGKKFWHYGKDFETTKRDHITFIERSQFIGAYLGDELIGFIKLVHGNQTANTMQILSKMAHRDKAPTNALLAKAVELCAQRKTPRLHYGMWSRRGLGEFKKNHGFQRVDVPRYFAPLTVKGKLLLKVKCHRQPVDYIPDAWRDKLVDLRGKWNEFVTARKSVNPIGGGR